VKTPKVHLGDTGLACALLGVSGAALAADRPLLGQLLETFVFQELRRQASWYAEPLTFWHYRDRDGVEVDIVIEAGAHAVAGVEVKAGATPLRQDSCRLDLTTSRGRRGEIGDGVQRGVSESNGAADDGPEGDDCDRVVRGGRRDAAHVVAMAA
jgi:predicted AAA+ superfamily ATPase